MALLLVTIGCVAPQLWTGVSEGGKGRCTFTYGEHPLAYYRNNIVPADTDVQWTIQHNKARIAESKTWNCGTIHGKAVCEIWNRLESSGYYNATKLLLLETTPGQYRVLYHLQDREQSMVRLAPTIAGNRIFIARRSRHGPSTHVHEVELLVDHKKGVLDPHPDVPPDRTEPGK